MLAVHPLHRECAPPGMADVLDFPIHSHHVDVGIPGLPLHTPFGLGGISPCLAEEWSIGYAVDGDHALAGAYELLDRVFGGVAPARTVVILHHHVIAGQRRRGNSPDLFLHSHIEEPRVNEHTSNEGYVRLPR